MATKTAMQMRRRMKIMTMITKTAMMNGMKNTKTMTSTMMMKTMMTTKMTMRETEEAEMAVAETDSATIRADSPPEAHAAAHGAVPQGVVVQEVVHLAVAHEVEAVAVPVTDEVLRKVIHSLETNILRVEAVPVHGAVPQAVVAVEVLPVDREAVLQAVHGVLPVADEVATADNEIARVDLPPTAEVLVAVPAEEAVSAAVADVILN